MSCGSHSAANQAQGSKDTTVGELVDEKFDAATFCGVAAAAAADASIGDDLAARAASLRSVSADMPTRIKSALGVSADAMEKMADAAKSDPTGKILAQVVTSLAADADLSAAQELIDETVAQNCVDAEGGNS